MTRLRALAVTVSLATGLVAAAPAGAQPETEAVRAAAESVMKQLEAFRRDDYDTAYTFASQEIRQIFDREAFERMVRTGYPEIARSTSAVVAESRQAPNGTVYLRLKIRGANGKSVEAVYEMVRETGGWRINGVVAKPDPGVV